MWEKEKGKNPSMGHYHRIWHLTEILPEQTKIIWIYNSKVGLEKFSASQYILTELKRESSSVRWSEQSQTTMEGTA